MGFCIVRGCKSRSDRYVGLKLYKFHILPKSTAIRAKWLAAMSRQECELPKTGSVCSKHFKDEDYNVGKNGVPTSLMKEAVPSLHLGSPADSGSWEWTSNMDFAMSTDSLHLDDLASSSSLVDFGESQDLPALNCVDLFSEDTALNSPSPGLEEKENRKSTDENLLDKEFSLEQYLKDTSNASPATFMDIEASPAVSYSSSAESVASSIASRKPKKVRKCFKCDIEFHRKRDLLHHLLQHVEMPILSIEKLSEDHPVVKDYLSDLIVRREPGGLKLKLKYSGSQNFEVVQDEPSPKQKCLRVLNANELNWNSDSKTSSAAKDSSDPFKIKDEITDPGSHPMFECPPLVGFDQFAGDNSDGTDELLKKLLDGGRQDDIVADVDWSGNNNEFISLDSLANMCPVCHMHFNSAQELFIHKKETMHDFHSGPHPSELNPINQMMNTFGPPPPRPQIHGHQVLHGPVFQSNHNQPQMRPDYHMFSQRFLPPMPRGARPVHIAHPPQFRPNPPPLYLGARDAFQIIRPAFSHNNAPYPRPNPTRLEMRNSLFLKSRLQRTGAPRNNGNNCPEYSNGPIILSAQTAVRPRFLHSQIRPGVPVIHSVHSGTSADDFQDQHKDIQINDSVTLSIKGKEGTKNPKEVASLLATRGIIVTKRNQPTESPASTSAQAHAQTQEVVQKLQQNNAVSIISKKKDDSAASAAAEEFENKFLSCPVLNCKEKFVTAEGLNRHTTRFHSDIPRPMNQTNSVDKTHRHFFRCKLCPLVFPSQETLLEHKKKGHVIKTGISSRPTVGGSVERATEAVPQVGIPQEWGIPIIDMQNEDSMRKLQFLGITNFIPLSSKTNSGMFGFPIVSINDSSSTSTMPASAQLAALGTGSVLSLGPIKQVNPKRTASNNSSSN